MRLILLVLFLGGIADNAHARPQYKKMFQRRFETRRAEVNATCAVCHPARSKKVRNAFGIALREELGRKNVKEPDVILAALDKAALATDPQSKRPFIELIKQDWRQLNGKDLEREKKEADEAIRLTEALRRAEITDRLEKLAQQFEGRRLPDVQFRMLDGNPLSSADLSDKVTVLHFWDYHGKPDAPYGDVGFLMHWYERRPTDVDLIGIAVDARLAKVAKHVDVTRDVSRFRRDWKLPYWVVLDTENVLSRLGDPQRVGGSLPLTLVVAADGTIVDYRAGVTQSPDLPELRRAVATARRK